MANNGQVTVEVKGLDILEKKLEQLPFIVARKGLRGALRKGGNVFKQGMVNGAPVDTGFLSKHFGVRIKMERNELAGTAYIGPQGKIDYPDDAKGSYRLKKVGKKVKKIGRVAVATVARFLEFGTSKMGKRPFMTQAYETQKQNVLDVVTKELADAIDEAARET